MSEDVRETVLQIYDTVADQSLWPEILSRVAENVDARGCLIWEVLETGDARQLNVPFASDWYDQDALDAYLAANHDRELADQDTFLAYARTRDPIDIIDDGVLYDDLGEFERREHVAYVKKLGILHRAAALLNKDNRAIGRFSVQFKASRGALTGKERTHLNRLLPHIAKALDLGRPAVQLAAERQSLIAAMDRLRIGICLLDPRGRVVTTNEEFRHQLDTRRAMYVSPGGELRMRRPADQCTLEALKTDALNHGRYGARPRKEAIRATDDCHLCIELTPLERSDEIGTSRFGGFVLYSTDTSLPLECEMDPLRQAFGLTDAEAALAGDIARGMTTPQIASRRERSPETVRSQVKSILGKTRCSNRTEFVRVMMQFGAKLLRH